jgi:hypothetical protein
MRIAFTGYKEPAMNLTPRGHAALRRVERKNPRTTVETWEYLLLKISFLSRNAGTTFTTTINGKIVSVAVWKLDGTLHFGVEVNGEYIPRSRVKLSDAQDALLSNGESILDRLQMEGHFRVTADQVALSH